jgi:GNAT superfamily N-acetyltransferase
MRAEPGVVLIAADWGPPAGVVAAHWRWTLEAASPIAQVSTLLVGPDDRRRGVGRLLLKAVSQAARQAGCGDLHLSVPHGQPELLAFARATGFSGSAAMLARALRKGG